MTTNHNNDDIALGTPYDVRRPVPGDVPAIYGLVSACDAEVLGHPDMTEADVADWLAEPGFDLTRDGWLVYARPGDAGDEAADGGDGGGNAGPVGWGLAQRHGTSDNVDVDVYARDAAVSAWLWDTVLRRARELATEAGHPHARADITIYRQDDAKRALAEEHGFKAATGFHRLRADHAGVDPGSLPGVEVRQAAGSEELTRAAHRIHQVGFAEHFGFVPKEYDQWREDFESASTHDWSQLLLAEVDGRPAAMLLGSDMFADDENCGYVRILSVLPEYRGRGLGRLLLRHAFAADERRGRAGTYLHVDTNNTSPALDLYLSVGMRPVLAMDVWRRTV
ncbi:GNAT family N-acetyltransferase [Sphaerisporangium corydalis]|uniref:GNAT family N-acetyltransferase n=1 Tax=Sphaerisporangium corydalis TaxID=1441875 RepID=A0ABV9EAD8_9ACTN|nr:GNAT family N-acetyltransferase [Sphaerisporangium corydalis]